MQDQQKLIQNNGEFQHGLFNCCDDCCLCCKAVCFPCCTIGAIKKKMNVEPCCGCLLFSCFPTCITCMTRGEVRDAKGIDGSCWEDCIASACCWSCTMHQMALEMEAEPGQFCC